LLLLLLLFTILCACLGAGVAIATALLSLALNKPVAPDLAMTGEITLTGRVLVIGGVKEKLLAAKRSGVKTVIFPEGNRRDFEELAPALKADVDAHFVSHFDQVFKLALEYDGPTPAAPPAAPAAAPAAPAS
jgi:Lon-like ATP-dependent protease